MSQPSLPTRVLAGITVPDTPTIAAAIAYVRAHSDDLTYNHIMRSWLFGSAIVSKNLDAAKDMDLEALAVSLLLHDLGWDVTGELVSADKRFEVDGAIAARNFLEREEFRAEWDKHRVQLVWDAIALHTTASLAQHKEPEVKACNFGIFMDFVGPDQSFGQLTWGEYEGIVKEFPRLKFIKGAQEILCGFCRTKPETTYDNIVSAFGVRYVEGYTLEGNTAVDRFAACPLPDSF